MAAPGTVLGDRYTLVRPLATGGMAEIFLARQSALAGFEKDVVVKRLKEVYRSDPRVVEMFLDEARIGAILNHPNVVHVYDVGEHEGLPYIVMELIHGDELSDLCRQGLELGNFLPLAHAVDLMRQAAEGMGYFHAKREEAGSPLAIVHRDISPSNLLVTTDGFLKVIDFGIARSARTRSHDEKMVPGKFNYMAPEQVRGEKCDHRADIFSLGIVLYEITVGKRLFKGRPEEVVQRIAHPKIKPPTFVRKSFPPALEAIVMRALESHPDDRYQGAYELANDLEEFLRGARLKTGPFRVAQYLDDLREAVGHARRPELVIAGEAWINDEGEDALDFDRGFADVVSAAPAAAAVQGKASDWDDDESGEDSGGGGAAGGAHGNGNGAAGGSANGNGSAAVNGAAAAGGSGAVRMSRSARASTPPPGARAKPPTPPPTSEAAALQTAAIEAAAPIEAPPVPSSPVVIRPAPAATPVPVPIAATGSRPIMAAPATTPAPPSVAPSMAAPSAFGQGIASRGGGGALRWVILASIAFAIAIAAIVALK